MIKIAKVKQSAILLLLHIYSHIYSSDGNCIFFSICREVSSIMATFHFKMKGYIKQAIVKQQHLIILYLTANWLWEETIRREIAKCPWECYLWESGQKDHVLEITFSHKTSIEERTALLSG